MEIGAIHLEYLSTPCTEFIADGKKQTASVIITPLRVIEENDMVKISTGCSMWKSCENGGCEFSKKSMDQSGHKKEGRAK